MKIALIPSAFHPSLGGVEEHNRQLAHALIKRGHEVIVITDRWPRDLPEFENFEGIKLYRVAMRGPEGNKKAKVTFTLTQNSIKKSMRQILRDFGADIIHLQCVSTNSYYSLDSSKELKVPLVVTAHGELTMDAARTYETSKFLPAVLIDSLRNASSLTACSQDTLRDVVDFYARKTGATLNCPQHPIHNGILLSEFANITAYQSAKPYIFAMGRFVAQKGFDVLIEAFNEAKVPNLNLIIAGDGDEKEKLKQLVVKHRLGDKVTFWGRASRQQVAELLKGSDFFVLPSRMEPMGIVNLEAMACGRAILASNTGGVPEIVTDGFNGILVSPDDVNALAQGITMLANNPELRKTLGENGREKVQAFDWGNVATKYETVYRSAIGTS